MLASLLLFLLPLPGHAAMPLINAQDLPNLVEKVMPGVVNISSNTIVNTRVFGWEDFLQGWGVPQERKQTSLGSGFLIDNEGYIITNNHVVAQADEVIVTLLDKRALPARIIGKDQKLDLALLKIRQPSAGAPTGPTAPILPVPFGDSDAVRIGEPVFAVGNPFGLQHTVTTGIISAKNRTIGLGPFDNFLQTDASINPGNSGGPLFNLKGEVIGVNTVIYSRTGQSGGLGFAIPSNEAKKVLADLKKYGRVPRPWLGILGERVTPVMARYYQLPLEKGVVVYNIVEGGPAHRAGLRPGDILVDVDGGEATELNDVERSLAKRRPKDSIHLKVRRGSRNLDITIKLEELPRLDQLPQGIL